MEDMLPHINTYKQIKRLTIFDCKMDRFTKYLGIRRFLEPEAGHKVANDLLEWNHLRAHHGSEQSLCPRELEHSLQILCSSEMGLKKRHIKYSDYNVSPKGGKGGGGMLHPIIWCCTPSTGTAPQIFLYFVCMKCANPSLFCQSGENTGD